MFKRIFTITLAALMVQGCATLFNSSIKTVSMSSTPADAEIWINGVNRGRTPISLDLDNHRDHLVVFRKEGYQDVACELTTSIGATWIILDVLGGLVPVVIDAATGEWNGIQQNTCNVILPAGEGVAPGKAGRVTPPDATDWTNLAFEHGWITLQEMHPTLVKD